MMANRKKCLINLFSVSIILLLIINGSCGKAPQGDDLAEQFHNPTSEEVAPWTFWYWMYGAVSKEGITADLEAMQEIGLGGAYLMPIRSGADNKTFDYSPTYDQLTPEWWEMVRFSMEEADRLGLKLGMHICDGFALAGGPWITPETSMQKVVWSDTIIEGGAVNGLSIPRPESYEDFYKDIALFAVPVANESFPEHTKPTVTSNGEDNQPGYLVDKGNDGTFRSSTPCWIQYDFKTEVVCRSVHIVPAGNNFQAQRLAVYASDDGVDFRKIKQLVPPRQGWQNTDEDFTFSIPATKARYFRFYWDPAGTEPGAEDLDAAKWKPNLRIKHIFLSGEALIDQYEGKNGSVWRVAQRSDSSEISDEDCINPEHIVQIPLSSLTGGLLTTSLPSGKWKIVRMGHTATGHTNATGGAGKGLECDKFTREAVETQLENWFGAAFRETDPELARKVLKYMHVDSWECGSQNWSANFPDEFKKRRGYDLLPYLLVYTGMPLASAEQTERILYDIRQTISELVVDVFYDVLANFADQYDCELSAECVSPTMVSDGMMHYRMVDRPMGEFWLNSPTHDKFNDMLDAVSGARVYGKNIIQGEGFTQLRIMWNETPAVVKPLLDRNYALGLNKLFHHVYAHNPYTDKAPGVTLDGIGLYFQRDQTWWKQGKAWVDYIKRCQTLLQAGRPVVDIAVFTGEEVPRRALLPERLVEALPGIFGEERVLAEKERLANVGQPLRVKPVGVTHSAGVTDAADWIDPLRGYAYDSFNRDALLRLAKVKDGKLVFEGGMEYSVVVIPGYYPLSPNGDYMSVEVAAKIKEMQDAGVVVLLGDKPIQSPSFKDDASATASLNGIVNEVWNVSEEYLLPYTDSNFNRFGVEKDVDFGDEKNIAWTHRKKGEIDIYFIANQKEKFRNFKVSFRCEGKQPELWDPVTGVMKPAHEWSEDEGRTSLSMKLEPYQSMFVVFRHSADDSKQVDHEIETRSLTVETGDWTVLFEKESDLQYNVEELFDWSKVEEKRVRYYSGTALYKTVFHLDSLIDKGFMGADKPDGDKDVIPGENVVGSDDEKGYLIAEKNLWLDLGKVHDLAEVYVNDTYCGTAWTYPYRVNVSSALRQGENRLEVRVVNGWANRIKGVHEGHIEDENVWTNTRYWIEKQPLQTSGLLGSLTIQREAL